MNLNFKPTGSDITLANRARTHMDLSIPYTPFSRVAFKTSLNEWLQEMGLSGEATADFIRDGKVNQNSVVIEYHL